MHPNTTPPRLALPVQLIPSPPPASTSSAEFFLIRVHGRWNRTTPATYVPRRLTRRRRSPPLPVQATVEYSRPSMPAAPVPRSTTVHPQHALPAKSARRAVTHPPDGFQSPPLRNSRPTAASALVSASPPTKSHLPRRDSAPAAARAPVAPFPSSRSSEYPPSCWPIQEWNLPKSRRELLRC